MTKRKPKPGQIYVRRRNGNVTYYKVVFFARKTKTAKPSRTIPATPLLPAITICRIALNGRDIGCRLVRPKFLKRLVEPSGRVRGLFDK